ncbi:MAG TPA: ABC transporter ATP-binding protein [Roseiflexaceae bacterium]|nr:ABC transporter ATP-binding protein [Roseiflexaceae bacterium]
MEARDTETVPALLCIRQLEAYYGRIRALKQVSLDVPEGSVVALLGANGAGKTTTLRVISGLLRPTRGSVEFERRPIARLSAEQLVRAGIAHVPEGRQLFPGLTVREHLRLGAYTRRDARAIDADLERVLHYFPRLAERLGQLAGTLSGGEQQMLAIGRALMTRPRLLLLDEPSLGLAPRLITEIFRIIAEIRAAGTTVLLVEQNVHMALGIADFGYLLENGRVVLSGDSATLRQRKEVQHAYLGG